MENLLQKWSSIVITDLGSKTNNDDQNNNNSNSPPF